MSFEITPVLPGSPLSVDHSLADSSLSAYSEREIDGTLTSCQIDRLAREALGLECPLNAVWEREVTQASWLYKIPHIVRYFFQSFFSEEIRGEQEKIRAVKSHLAHFEAVTRKVAQTLHTRIDISGLQQEEYEELRLSDQSLLATRCCAISELEKEALQEFCDVFKAHMERLDGQGSTSLHHIRREAAEYFLERAFRDETPTRHLRGRCARVQALAHQRIDDAVVSALKFRFRSTFHERLIEDYTASFFQAEVPNPQECLTRTIGAVQRYFPRQADEEHVTLFGEASSERIEQVIRERIQEANARHHREGGATLETVYNRLLAPQTVQVRAGHIMETLYEQYREKTQRLAEIIEGIETIQRACEELRRAERARQDEAVERVREEEAIARPAYISHWQRQREVVSRQEREGVYQGNEDVRRVELEGLLRQKEVLEREIEALGRAMERSLETAQEEINREGRFYLSFAQMPSARMERIPPQTGRTMDELDRHIDTLLNPNL